MANPLLVKNFVADAAVASYRLVKHGAGDDRAVQAAGSTDLVFGASTEANAAAGERLDVQLTGLAFVEAGGVIPRGSRLTSDAQGRAVVAAPAVGVNTVVAGIAMEAATGAGDVIKYLQSPSLAQG